MGSGTRTIAFLCLVLFTSTAWGRTYFASCYGCDPGNPNDARVHQILLSYPVVNGDYVSIQVDTYEGAPHFGYYCVNWRFVNNAFTAVWSGYNPLADGGGGSGGGGEGGGGGPGGGGGGNPTPPPGGGTGGSPGGENCYWEGQYHAHCYLYAVPPDPPSATM